MKLVCSNYWKNPKITAAVRYSIAIYIAVVLFTWFLCVFQEVNFWQIHGRYFVYLKFVRVRKMFCTQVFAGFAVLITISKMRDLCSRLLFHYKLLINRLLTSVFVLVNRKVFRRSNNLIIKRLITCLIN